MAVNPKKLLETILESEKSTISRLEKKYDAHLTKRFDGSKVYIDINGDFSSLRKPAQEMLLNKYRREGWDVRAQYDQRDGNSLVFAYNPSSGSSYRPDFVRFER